MEPFSNMNDNYSNNDYPNKNEYRYSTPPNMFSVFARSLGLASILCAVFSIFYGTFITGGLAIVLALLSRGSNTKMDNRAKIGLIAGSVGVILQIAIFAVSVYSVIYIPEYRQQFNSLYEQMYGESFDESLEDILENFNGNISDLEGGNL